MNLYRFFKENYPFGIEYENAVVLCLAIYSSENFIPVLDPESCNIDEIGENFSKLAGEGYIKNYEKYKAVPYGASYHNLNEKGHWVEVITSIFKAGQSVDLEQAKAILEELKGAD